MHIVKFILFFILLNLYIYPSFSQNIFRFEHFNSEDGLSQNTVTSLLCDRNGFLWIGTMNGLNRFDGYHFKIYKGGNNQEDFITNNRVTKLWQDEKGFIWMETYDHYFHFFNPKTEIFTSIPNYNDPDYDKINESSCYLQYKKDKIWIGTSGRGVYYLKYSPSKDTYTKTQISDKGRYTISNKNVNFIINDFDSDIWVGTQNGINLLTQHELKNNSFDFQHFFIDYNFTSSIVTNHTLWFATKKNGIVTYDKKKSSYRFININTNPLFPTNKILKLYKSKNNLIFIAFEENGLLIYNTKTQKWTKAKIHGKNVNKIYFDLKNQAWVTTDKYGVTRIDLSTLESETYQLTNSQQKAITDRERHYFYEDKDSCLWIGLHGGGLAFYNRPENKFTKYENNPNQINSISSNIVHCITEDKNGQMWLGTGQYKGGMEKVIRKNSAFQNIKPDKHINMITDNLVRSVFQDSNGCIWIGTKGGKLYLYNSSLEKIYSFNYSKNQKKTNIYSIFADKNNHIWLGTKGEGILVSKNPIPQNINNYNQLQFVSYIYDKSDTLSLADDNIYSIEQDYKNNIWIGTFGNGISVTNPKEGYENLKFHNYNSTNSSLSNDLVRKIKMDTDSNIWVATTFGLNILYADSLKNKTYHFESIFKSTKNNNKINYNDIVDVFEDAQKRLWFGTMGGGVSMVSLPYSIKSDFKSFTSNEGLSNDVIYETLQDAEGNYWFSSENGLSFYKNKDQSIKIFNESTGLLFNNFSENTGCRLSNGNIIFGGSQGAVIVNPALLKNTQHESIINLTNFQIFNKDVKIGDKNSPLHKSISFTKELTLNYDQSSFSLEYSALDYQDPQKIQYAYILKGFDDNWNYVGNQTKATYTNLKNGSYEFKVKSTNNNGLWNSTERIIKINILAPWWKTKYALLSYIIIVLLLLYIAKTIITRINKYRNDLSVEKQINDLKIQFFTNISHEIRTPLTLISGPLEDILYDGNYPSELRRPLSIMQKNTNRMLDLVNQLLDFRRIQSEQTTLSVQKIDIVSFTKNIYETFIPLSKHKALQFNFHSDLDDLFIWADISKLDTIIYNLISNAVKFTPTGKKVQIFISKDEENNMAKIEVTDEGPGIPKDQQKNIFNRYIQLHDSLNNIGSGIGLSLAYELAHLHNGTIGITSEENEGSTFCFTIPISKETITSLKHVKELNETDYKEIDHTTEIAEENTNLINNKINKELPIILIIEDNEQIASYLQSYLSQFYNCYLANNGIEGLKQTEIHNPDVIITDIMMPKMDGIEFTKNLKKNFSTCHIPVVMLTAKTDIEDEITGINTGAEAYITKPINSRYLKAVINNLIEQRKLIISKYRDNKTIDPKTLKVNTKDEEFLIKVTEYIEKNYSNDVTVDSLVDFCCVSRTVFYNKIKGLTGLSPLEFIRQFKLKIASQLLKKGYSVSDVAFKIGYTDTKYFSKQFKLHYGYPPSKIKKKL